MKWCKANHNSIARQGLDREFRFINNIRSHIKVELVWMVWGALCPAMHVALHHCILVFAALLPNPNPTSFLTPSRVIHYCDRSTESPGSFPELLARQLFRYAKWWMSRRLYNIRFYIHLLRTQTAMSTDSKHRRQSLLLAMSQFYLAADAPLPPHHQATVMVRECYRQANRSQST